MKKHIEVVHKKSGGGGGAVYGLGIIGALIYYLGNMTSFSDFFWGVLKSLLWPAFLIHRALEVLGM